MGMILAFEPRKTSLARPPGEVPSTPSIVIFPGVRYERYPAKDTAAAQLPFTDPAPQPPASIR